MAKGRKFGGRKAGTPNRITRTLTEAIDAAFDEVGGVSYLVKIAHDEPKAFCALLGKRLPKDVHHTLEVSLVEAILALRKGLPGERPSDSTH